MHYFSFFLLCGFLITQSGSPSFQSYSQQLEGTDLSIDMIAISGGTFHMGSPEKEPGRQPDEGPVHEVYVDSFWLASLEITWEIYEQFLNRKKDKDTFSSNILNLGIEPNGISGATIPYVDMSLGMGKDNFPVTNVTQYAALTFCKWLSAKTGYFYRLPTEAEWEYACKKGQEEKQKDLHKQAWFQKNSNEKYQPTGTKSPNTFGVYDMLGNVAEWTMDQYIANYYSDSPVDNPWAVPDQLYPRSLRGGSWKDDETQCRCSARKKSNPRWKRIDPQLPKSRWWHTNAPFVGFRILRPFKTPPPDEIKKYWLEAIDDF